MRTSTPHSSPWLNGPVCTKTAFRIINEADALPGVPSLNGD
ncbi:hypothetical protein HMPREF3038_01460 [Akkermansia sp. KLE1797]|nr:hypothetical protein HMPREF3038_01460 [Akkermansia sp. KLE1797]KXU55472.1 hypothetical protein HMPREF3039_00369 [Akkermansia sp. KLE1798]KZA03439.1 hypothetical protein HMPREF1326_02868 [Akkermansia sp. KLE1605]